MSYNQFCPQNDICDCFLESVRVSDSHAARGLMHMLMDN